MLTRVAPVPALTAALLVAGPSGSRAEPDVAESPTPCVNREAQAWRQVREVELGAHTLAYCTGDDCWSFDRASHAITAAPRRLTQAPPPLDPPGVMTDGHGTTLATADETHVEFCPTGQDGKPPCQSFAYKLPAPVAEVYPKLNDARTLGTVFATGEGDLDPPKWLLAFNLSLHKQVGRLEGQWIRVLDHGFLVDDETFYDARFRKIAKIAAPDQVWVKLGSTDRIALRDRERGEIVVQSTTTGKARRIPHGAGPQVRFDLIATPDGATLYAIGAGADEGEVLVIDVAAAKITARAAPTVCAPGTRRVN